MTDAHKERSKAFRQVCNDLAVVRLELEKSRAQVLRLSEDLRHADAEVERWKRLSLFGGSITCQNMGAN